MELSVHGLTGSMRPFKTSVKRQLSKLVIAFSPRALQKKAKSGLHKKNLECIKNLKQKYPNPFAAASR